MTSIMLAIFLLAGIVPVPVQAQNPVWDLFGRTEGMDFSSRRLIVLVQDESDLLEDDGEKLGSYGGAWLLRYGSEEETRQAYLAYRGHLKKVYPDTEIQAAGRSRKEAREETDILAQKARIEKPVSAGESGMSGSRSSGNEEKMTDPASMTKQDNPFVNASEQEEEKKTKKGTVALIDTGVSDPSVVQYDVAGGDPPEKRTHGDEMLFYLRAANPDAQVLSVRALDEQGHGSVSAVYAAIKLAIESGVSYINLSFSAPESKENACIAQVINEAVRAGITVTAAAGNDGSDAGDYVPGCVESALVAGSVNADGRRNVFSNYGDTVDYYLVSDSTSEAAARLCGYLSAGRKIEALETEALLFREAKDTRDGTKRYRPISDLMDGNWKLLSDEKIDEYYWDNGDEELYHFLKSLTDEELEELDQRHTGFSENTWVTQADGSQKPVKTSRYLLEEFKPQEFTAAVTANRNYGFYYLNVGGTSYKVYVRIAPTLNGAKSNNNNESDFDINTQSMYSYVYRVDGDGKITVTGGKGEDSVDKNPTVHVFTIKYTHPAYRVADWSCSNAAYFKEGNGYLPYRVNFSDQPTVDGSNKITLTPPTADTARTATLYLNMRQFGIGNAGEMVYIKSGNSYVEDSHASVNATVSIRFTPIKLRVHYLRNGGSNVYAALGNDNLKSETNGCYIDYTYNRVFDGSIYDVTNLFSRTGYHVDNANAWIRTSDNKAFSQVSVSYRASDLMQINTSSKSTLYHVYLKANWKINTLQIRYHLNGGTLKSGSKLGDGTVLNADSAGNIYKTAVNNEANRIIQTKTYSAGETINLLNAGPSGTTINAVRTNYTIAPGTEWKTSGGVKFNHNTNYVIAGSGANAALDITKSSKVVDLYLNWKTNEPKYLTIVYHINHGTLVRNSMPAANNTSIPIGLEDNDRIVRADGLPLTRVMYENASSTVNLRNVALSGNPSFLVKRDGYHIEAGKEWRDYDGTEVFDDDGNQSIHSGFFDVSDESRTVYLYINWLPNRCKIMFHPNISNDPLEQEETTQEMEYGSGRYTLDANPFHCRSMQFAGWSKEPGEGKKILYSDKGEVDTAELEKLADGAVYHLYAQWKEKEAASVKVHFLDESLDYLADPVEIEGKAGDAYRAVPKKIKGYVLTEWGTDDSDPASGIMEGEKDVNFIYRRAAAETFPSAGEIKEVQIDQNVRDQLQTIHYRIRKTDENNVPLNGAVFQIRALVDIKDASGRVIYEKGQIIAADMTKTVDSETAQETDPAETDQTQAGGSKDTSGEESGNGTGTTVGEQAGSAQDSDDPGQTGIAEFGGEVGLPTWHFADAASYALNGGYMYEITEVSAPEGYTKSDEVIRMTGKPDQDAAVTTVSVNVPNKENNWIRVEKIWLDGSTKKRPEALYVDVLNGSRVVACVELNEKNGWKAELNGKDGAPLVDRYDEDGNPILYSVREKTLKTGTAADIPDGYLYVPELSGYDSRTGSAKVANRTETVSATAVKKWDDEEDADGIRPGQVEVDLLSINVADEDDKELYRGGAYEDITLSNKLSEEETQKQLHDAPVYTVYQLSRDEEADTTTYRVYKPYILDEACGFSVTVDDLPTKRADGVFVRYEFVERTNEVINTDELSGYSIRTETETAADERTGQITEITNTHRVVPTSAKVIKKWEPGGFDVNPLERIFVALKKSVVRDGKTVTSEVESGIELNEKNKWTYEKKELPRYDHGEEVSYWYEEMDRYPSLEEELAFSKGEGVSMRTNDGRIGKWIPDPDCYRKGSPENGNTTLIVNRFTLTGIPVTIEKYWEDGKTGEEAEKRPVPVFTLRGYDASGQEVTDPSVPLPATSSPDLSAWKTESDERWNYTFENMPADLDYEVTEAPYDGYKTMAEGTEGSTAKVRIIPSGSDKKGEISFVNTMEKGYSFTVEKLVRGQGADRKKAFAFTAGIGGLKANTEYSMSVLPHSESGTRYEIKLGAFFNKEKDLQFGFDAYDDGETGSIASDSGITSITSIPDYDPDEYDVAYEVLLNDAAGFRGMLQAPGLFDSIRLYHRDGTDPSDAGQWLAEILYQGEIVLEKTALSEAGGDHISVRDLSEAGPENNRTFVSNQDGKASVSFTLAHLDRLRINGLPENAEVKVAEEDLQNGYSTFWQYEYLDEDGIANTSDEQELADGKTVRIKKEQRDPLIRCINEASLTRNLTLKKKVTGNMGNRRKRFLFSADVSGLAPNTGYTVIINRGEQAENMTLHSDGTGKMNIAAGLAHEESITIIGVPVGAQCKIRERSGLYPAYNTAWEYQYRDQSGTVCSFAQDTQEMKNMMPESRDGELAECIWTADPAQEDAVLTCINDRDQTIPAGVLARPLTLSAGMAGAIAAIMAFLLRRRWRNV